MLGHSLLFSQAYYLRLERKQLIIQCLESKESLKRIPVEDISFIVFDHPQVKTSLGLLQALMEAQVILIFCDHLRQPHSQLLPFSGHHIYQQRLRLQLQQSLPHKKGLWQQIVKAKVKNQGAVVKKWGGLEQPFITFRRKVKSGDSGKIEGQAARAYFPEIFGFSFTRNRYGAVPNNYLNYGYTLLRAAVNRCLVASGLLPALGLEHKNKYNPFCLADDLMEPYRPFIDDAVRSWLEDEALEEELSSQEKGRLIQILQGQCQLGNKSYPLLKAIELSCQSLALILEGKRKKLQFPEL